MTNRKGRGSACKTLPKDKEVKRWYDNLARGSIVTADVYLPRLGNFCEAHKLTPKKLATKSEKEIYAILLGYVTKLEEMGFTGPLANEKDSTCLMGSNLPPSGEDKLERPEGLCGSLRQMYWGS